MANIEMQANKLLKTTLLLNTRTLQGKILAGFITMATISILISLLSYSMMKLANQRQHEITLLLQTQQHEDAHATALKEEVERLQTLDLYLTIAFVVAMIAFGYFISSRIIHHTVRNLEKIQWRITELASGNIPEMMEDSADEMSGIIESINQLIKNLSQVKSFAEEVGNGHFDSEIVVFNNQGVLGKSLEHMRKSLKDVADEDKVRNWASEGIAKFAQLLRQNNDNLEELCHNVLKELVNYLQATQGAMFIATKEGEETLLTMKACYAYERRKFKNKTLKLGEGLAGQVFLEKETVLLTEVPQNYVNITSGLGEALPRSILIVPLKLNEEVMGILEIASLHVFQQKHISLVEKIAENIASTISGVKVAEETNRLLRESLMSGEQLKAQEEEMRQNLEELQATQEQMIRQSDEMRAMQESYLLEKSMLNSLLENLPYPVTFKDTSLKYKRVGKAKATLLGASPERLTGSTDYDYFSEEYAIKSTKEEEALIHSNGYAAGMVEDVELRNGAKLRYATTRFPWKDSEGKTIGIVCVSDKETKS